MRFITGWSLGLLLSIVNLINFNLILVGKYACFKIYFLTLIINIKVQDQDGQNNNTNNKTSHHLQSAHNSSYSHLPDLALISYSPLLTLFCLRESLLFLPILQLLMTLLNYSHVHMGFFKIVYLKRLLLIYVLCYITATFEAFSLFVIRITVFPSVFPTFIIYTMCLFLQIIWKYICSIFPNKQ